MRWKGCVGRGLGKRREEERREEEKNLYCISACYVTCGIVGVGVVWVVPGWGCDVLCAAY